MLLHMRTTILLPDDLYRDVRASAAGQGRTVTSFIEDALRAALRRLDEASARREPYVIRPFDGGVLPPDLDLDDNSAVLDFLDDDARS